jgi:hypothetical protein
MTPNIDIVGNSRQMTYAPMGMAAKYVSNKI